MPAPADKKNSTFWQLPVSAVLELFAAGSEGLGSAESALALTRFGPNLQFPAKFKNPPVAVAALLPFTAAGRRLGFVAPPGFFFLILTAMLLAYLLAVEGMKRWFFRRFAAE